VPYWRAGCQGALPGTFSPLQATFLHYSKRVKPGKPPEVRKGQDSITIVMDVAPATSRSPIRLVVRCERDGEIYASIERGPDPNTE